MPQFEEMVLACRTSLVEIGNYWNFARECLLFMSTFAQSTRFPCVGSQIGLLHPNYWIHDVGDSLGNAILSHGKMHIFNIIHFKTNGLHVILGT
jgi:hypothetical protein